MIGKHTKHTMEKDMWKKKTCLLAKFVDAKQSTQCEKPDAQKGKRKQSIIQLLFPDNRKDARNSE